ncbi:apolipoprotein A-II [Anolis sagrei]|uniref:apolipoprotein A-II n=1 Tax=Anolis sagrei TaxID=38937 RepID=UPI0035212CA7
MKVLVLAVLLVSICSLEGAFVKRQAEGDSQAQEVSRYFPALAQLFPQDLFGEEKIGQLRTQVQTLAQQAQESLKPLADQMRESLNQIIAALEESVKKATTTSS